MAKTKRVAIYARVSTDRQETENQLVQLRDFANRQGWQITNEYVDVVTGGKSDRPQFQQLFSDASKRLFDVCLFWSLDRWSREGAFKTLEHLERLKGYGIGFRSYTEAFLDTTTLGPFADAIIALLGALARQEKIRIGERTRAGLARARKQGRIGGRPAFAADLKDRARKLREQGLSLPKIAAELKVSVGFVHAATKAVIES